MPRIPFKQFKPRTPLARLRREFLFHKAGNPFHKAEKPFYQQDLANDLGGLSVVRIQQLELGTEALPEKHALKCQKIYGISADWLLKGDPKARPVTPEGKPYSKAIAANSRKSYHFRLSKGPTANDAWHLSLSAEALFSVIRTAIIRANQDGSNLMAAVALFCEIRDAVLPPLRDADPSTPVDSRLQVEAERLRVSRDKYERHRLDLTQQCLGVDVYPIRDQDGKESEFYRTLDPAILKKFSRKTGYRHHARIVCQDGKVSVHPITHEEALKFQPVPPKEESAPQRATAHQRSKLTGKWKKSGNG